MSSIAKSTIASFFGLIALMLILEHYAGVSSILGGTEKLATGVVGAFNTAAS